jgi:hypothetical protein
MGMSEGPDDLTRWRRQEEPLLAIDPLLSRLARRWKVKLSKNSHEGIERSLEWRTRDGIHRIVQIWHADPRAVEPVFKLWIAASLDTRRGRHWKQQYIRTDLRLPVPDDELIRLYEEAYGRVSSFRRDDLEPAYPDAQMPC